MKTTPVLPFLLLALGFEGKNSIASASEQCEPCLGGAIDSSLSFNGISCDRWLSLAGNSAAESSECAFDRMIGVWFCGCPVPSGIEETCTLCANGNTEFTSEKPFPDSSITCAEIATVPALDGAATCDELHFMGQFCGCAETTSTCEICPNGLQPDNLDNVFWHTGESCRYVQEVMSLSPMGSCEMYLPDMMMVDVSAYCGCAGSEAPFSCNLCPKGQYVPDETKPVSYAQGATCGDFDSYANFVTDDTFCGFLQEVVAPDCCEPYTFARDYQCDFCPDGHEVSQKERILVGSNTTCDELANRQGSDECSALYSSNLDSLIDTRIYCGCPDENPIGLCDFCPPGEVLLYPTKAISMGQTNTTTDATCSDYAALADSTFDESFCSAVKDVGVVNGCCGAPPVEAERNATVEEIETCSLCPMGLPSGDPEKVFIGTTLKCIDYELELQTLPPGEECDEINRDFASTFDPTVYCQCPGVKSEATCRFCPEGQVLTDPSAWISEIFTTCSQMADVARSTSDEQFCDSLQRVGEYYCCGDPGDTRHLSQKEPSPVSLKPELRPYHFAALKALDTVRSSIARIVDSGDTKLDPYEN